MSHNFSLANVNDVILSAIDVQWLLIGQCEWCHLISHGCLMTSHWPMWMMSSYQPQMSNDFSLANVNDVILSAMDVSWLLIGQCEWCHFISHRCLMTSHWPMWLMSYNQPQMSHDFSVTNVNDVILSATDVQWLLIGQCEWCHLISHRCLITSHWPMWMMSSYQPQMSNDFSLANVNDVILSAMDVSWLLIGQCEWCHLISHGCLMTSHWPMWMMSSYQPQMSRDFSVAKINDVILSTTDVSYFSLAHVNDVILSAMMSCHFSLANVNDVILSATDVSWLLIDQCEWCQLISQEIFKIINSQTKFEIEREIKFINLLGDRGHRGPYSPYKPCNHNLYIGIIIFPHIDNPQSTDYN